MAEFLTTADISARLQKIIKEAEEYLVLISPYLKVNSRVREFLEQKSRSKTHIRIIYGKRELQPEEREWIDSLDTVELLFRENLHAKCYLNEKEALLTSMNLYQFSEQNNDEMGIIFSKGASWNTKDRDLYTEIYKEAEDIAQKSEKIREVPKSKPTPGFAGRLLGAAKDALLKTAESSAIPEPNSASDYRSDSTVDAGDKAAADLRQPQEEKPISTPARPAPGIPTSGFCIRCKTVLPINPEQPYCNSCYQSWNRYKNEAYEEKHCHICGNEKATTRIKPLCLTCYRSYKDVFTFAGSQG